jgi:hypothetical protein
MLTSLEDLRIPRSPRPVKTTESLPGVAVATENPGPNSMFKTFFNFADNVGLRRVGLPLGGGLVYDEYLIAGTEKWLTPFTQMFSFVFIHPFVLHWNNHKRQILIKKWLIFCFLILLGLVKRSFRTLDSFESFCLFLAKKKRKETAVRLSEFLWVYILSLVFYSFGWVCHTVSNLASQVPALFL